MEEELQGIGECQREGRESVLASNSDNPAANQSTKQVDDNAIPPAGQIQSARDTLDVLFALLDVKFSKWDIYRTAMNEWCFRGLCRDGSGDFSFTRESMIDSLIDAIEFIPLPTVPSRPNVYDRKAFQAYKDGYKWRLKYLGQDFGVLTQTKAQAEQAADKISQHSRESHDRWMTAYGWTIDKVEGKDFRYKG